MAAAYRFALMDTLTHLGLVATKRVFEVFDKARLKPVPSATETS